MGRLVYVGDCTWKEAAEVLKEADVCLLPFGSFEQHGPHLPLGTDTLIADALIQALRDYISAGTISMDIAAMPTVPYGMSPEHEDFAGTCSMDRNGFLGFVKNAVRRLAESGAKLIVLFNCHGGNTPYLQIAARECRYELDVTPVLFDVYAGDTAAKFSGPLDYHAGTFETSLMHALVPGAVRSGDSITEVWSVDPRKEAMGATGYPWSSSDFSDTGMIGDPSSADAEIGRQIVGELVVEIITALKTYIGL